MGTPTSYSEGSLEAYMLEVTDAIGASFGLGISDFAEALDSTLLAYGVTDVADATDMLKLRSIAKVNAWRVVLSKTGQGADIFEAVLANLKAAERELASYAQQITSPEYQMQVTELNYTQDPYNQVFIGDL